MKTLVDDIMEKMPEQFNMLEIQAKVEERTPYVIVCFQVKMFHKQGSTPWLPPPPLLRGMTMKMTHNRHYIFDIISLIFFPIYSNFLGV